MMKNLRRASEPEQKAISIDGEVTICNAGAITILLKD